MKKPILKFQLFVFCLVALTLGGIACNKNKEKVAQLEKEVQQAEAQLQGYQPESDTTPAEISSNPVTATAAFEDSVVRDPSRIPDVTDTMRAADLQPVGRAADSTPAPSKAVSMPPHLRGGYTIQVGAGIDRAAAEESAARLRGDGYDAYVSEKRIEGILHFRVRVGRFESQAEARRLGREIGDEYSLDYWIANLD